LIGIGMRKDVKAWYPTIRKPRWTPPNWLFGPVWTALYAMMGVASHRVASIVGWTSRPLVLYGAQLVLNFLWSPLFFKWHKLGAAAVDITVLLGVVYATIVEFGAVDVLSAQLLVPYLAWSCYATALTYNIWLNN
jgi:benzodiazapine receptor